MLEEIAVARGARSEVTLTGFKWIWSAALALEEAEHVRFQFGFEEAIGFSVGHVVRDKDGISAALVFAELAARCNERGVSVLEELARLYARYGLWVSVQHSIVRPGLRLAFGRSRSPSTALSASPPAALAGVAVTAVVDYRPRR